MQWRSVRRLSVRPSVNFSAQISSRRRRQMAGWPPNLHTMDCRSACVQGVLKVKVKVKGHVICALFWNLGMSYAVVDGLVLHIAQLNC